MHVCACTYICMRVQLCLQIVVFMGRLSKNVVLISSFDLEDGLRRWILREDPS